MIIVIDTREQHPYSFSTPSARRKLDSGDYSIAGFENRVAVERKELNDYIQTIIYHRDRFAKELALLAHYDLKVIVVEGSLADIVEHRYTGGIEPKSIIAATATLFLRFSVPIFFASNRQIACHFTESLLTKYYDMHSHRKVRPQ